VTVVERDESDRLIRYENDTQDSRIRVTHKLKSYGRKSPLQSVVHRLLVPRQCIRFEDDKLENLNVSFLDRHYITLKNDEGYKVYKAHTTYKFDTVPDREDFLVQVRERTLLGPFFALKVYHRNNLVAQDKVVRFWKKPAENVPSAGHRPDITVSFLGRDEVQYELSLKDFHRSPTIEKGNRVVLISRADGKRTEFVFKPPGKIRERRRLSLRRPSREPDDDTQSPPEASDAERFKALFEANHPLTSPLASGRKAVRETDAGPLYERLETFAMSTAGSTTSGSGGGVTSSANTSPDPQEEPVSPSSRRR